MIEIDEFTTLEPSTQEDIDYVETNFREGDRLEHESLDGGRTLIKIFEDCWTVKHKGEIIGYCGVMPPYGETFYSNKRWLCYMSCENANKYKISYVKLSRKVMKAIIAETPEYVDIFMSLPNEDYVGSVLWHERVLKMRRIDKVSFSNANFVLFGITRKEALG